MARRRIRRKIDKTRVLYASFLSLALSITAYQLLFAPASRAESDLKRPLPKTPSLSEPYSFFHPIWVKEDIFDGSRHVWEEGSASAALVRELVTDPDNKIEPVFKVPSGLVDRVGFWMEIYSRYSSRMRLVHDRKNLSAIYGYIDFRPLYRAMGKSRETDLKAAELERKILKDLKQRLLAAAGVRNGVVLSAEEKGQMENFLSQQGALSIPRATALASEIRSQSGQSDMFVSALYRSRDLLPHIESVFRKQNLPGGLARLPFVESSFNVQAHSKIGALGIWQFTPETAREMIHHVQDKSWSDPLKQTASAARMLKMYRSVLPDWGLTITSYNSGVGHVRRMVEKRHVKSVEQAIKLEGEDGLGFAGKNFYSEFLAANLVEAYKDKLFNGFLNSANFELVLRDSSPFKQEACRL